MAKFTKQSLTVKNLQKTILEQKKEIKRLKFLANKDLLTGLYNRHGFIEEAEKFFDSIKKQKSKEKRKFNIENFSIIFIDLDNLKPVNDLYGHKNGDLLLVAVADILKKSLREIDIISRWGGDEFIVGLINTEEQESVKIAEKVRKKISEIKIKSIPKKTKFSASIGIVSANNQKRKHAKSLYELIEKADLAMYEAKKENGKNFIVVF